jgi:Transglutaminase-like superfamily
VSRLRLIATRGPLAAEAAISLAAASVAIRVLSRQRITRLLGRPVSPEVLVPGPPAREARAVGRAVERVAARLPWHPPCLPQAIATRWMLRRRGIGCEAHLGVTGTDPLEAHAWITVCGVVVQGGPIRHATEVALLR